MSSRSWTQQGPAPTAQSLRAPAQSQRVEEEPQSPLPAHSQLPNQETDQATLSSARLETETAAQGDTGGSDSPELGGPLPPGEPNSGEGETGGAPAEIPDPEVCRQN